MYHSKEAAEKAEKEFDKIFIKKGIPDNIPEYIPEVESMQILDLITTINFAPSKGEARRLIKQGGVSILPADGEGNGEKITDFFQEIKFDKEKILKVGKRKFMKLMQKN